ncbi:MAG: hypothetical protein IJ415_04775 [Clostridia bacterium]|nr:hypothetical protein [Clostridia bacterium]
MSTLIVLIYLALLGLAVFILHLCSKLTMDLLIKKGYQAKYWIGFVFGPLSWLYCLALPDLKTQKALKDISESMKEEK